jgi:hypothetical protein
MNCWVKDQVFSGSAHSFFAAITGQRMQCPRTHIRVGVVQVFDQTRQARIIIDMVQHYATTDSDQMFWML